MTYIQPSTYIKLLLLLLASASVFYVSMKEKECSSPGINTSIGVGDFAQAKHSPHPKVYHWSSHGNMTTRFCTGLSMLVNNPPL